VAPSAAANRAKTRSRPSPRLRRPHSCACTPTRPPSRARCQWQALPDPGDFDRQLELELAHAEPEMLDVIIVKPSLSPHGNALQSGNTHNGTEIVAQSQSPQLTSSSQGPAQPGKYPTPILVNTYEQGPDSPPVSPLTPLPQGWDTEDFVPTFAGIGIGAMTVEHIAAEATTGLGSDMDMDMGMDVDVDVRKPRPAEVETGVEGELTLETASASASAMTTPSPPSHPIHVHPGTRVHSPSSPKPKASTHGNYLRAPKLPVWTRSRTRTGAKWLGACASTPSPPSPRSPCRPPLPIPTDSTISTLYAAAARLRRKGAPYPKTPEWLGMCEKVGTVAAFNQPQAKAGFGKKTCFYPEEFTRSGGTGGRKKDFGSIATRPSPESGRDNEDENSGGEKMKIRGEDIGAEDGGYNINTRRSAEPGKDAAQTLEATPVNFTDGEESHEDADPYGDDQTSPQPESDYGHTLSGRRLTYKEMLSEEKQLNYCSPFTEVTEKNTDWNRREGCGKLYPHTHTPSSPLPGGKEHEEGGFGFGIQMGRVGKVMWIDEIVVEAGEEALESEESENTSLRDEGEARSAWCRMERIRLREKKQARQEWEEVKAVTEWRRVIKMQHGGEDRNHWEIESTERKGSRERDNPSERTAMGFEEGCEKRVHSENGIGWQHDPDIPHTAPTSDHHPQPQYLLSYQPTTSLLFTAATPIPNVPKNPYSRSTSPPQRLVNENTPTQTSTYLPITHHPTSPPPSWGNIGDRMLKSISHSAVSPTRIEEKNVLVARRAQGKLENARICTVQGKWESSSRGAVEQPDVTNSSSSDGDNNSTSFKCTATAPENPSAEPAQPKPNQLEHRKEISAGEQYSRRVLHSKTSLEPQEEGYMWSSAVIRKASADWRGERNMEDRGRGNPRWLQPNTAAREAQAVYGGCKLRSPEGLPEGKEREMLKQQLAALTHFTVNSSVKSGIDMDISGNKYYARLTPPPITRPIPPLRAIQETVQPAAQGIHQEDTILLKSESHESCITQRQRFGGGSIRMLTHSPHEEGIAGRDLGTWRVTLPVVDHRPRPGEITAERIRSEEQGRIEKPTQNKEMTTAEKVRGKGDNTTVEQARSPQGLGRKQRPLKERQKMKRKTQAWEAEKEKAGNNRVPQLGLSKQGLDIARDGELEATRRRVQAGVQVVGNKCLADTEKILLPARLAALRVIDSGEVIPDWITSMRKVPRAAAVVQTPTLPSLRTPGVTPCSSTVDEEPHSMQLTGERRLMQAVTHMEDHHDVSEHGWHDEFASKSSQEADWDPDLDPHSVGPQAPPQAPPQEPLPPQSNCTSSEQQYLAPPPPSWIYPNNNRHFPQDEGPTALPRCKACGCSLSRTSPGYE